MREFKIVDWSSFKHYAGQTSWFKVEKDIVDSDYWLQVSDETKLLIFVCLFVADEDGVFQEDTPVIKRKTNIDFEPDFQELVDCGFLEITAEC